MDTRHVMDFRPNFTTLKNSYAGAPALVAGARWSRGDVCGFLLPYFLNCLHNKFTVARPCHAAILPPVCVRKLRRVAALSPQKCGRRWSGGGARRTGETFYFFFRVCACCSSFFPYSPFPSCSCVR